MGIAITLSSRDNLKIKRIRSKSHRVKYKNFHQQTDTGWLKFLGIQLLMMTDIYHICIQQQSTSISQSVALGYRDSIMDLDGNVLLIRH